MSASSAYQRLELPLFWALLALPAVWLLWLWLSGDSTPHYLLHPSGEYSARLLIVALAATPLRMLFPRARWSAWLLRRRRHIGVAAMAYALLHTLFYLIDEGSLRAVLANLIYPSLIAGWLATGIFLALGATSNDAAMRALGKRWKRLQRWAHAAAVLTLLHWLLLEYNWLIGLLHFAPLAALQAWRWHTTRALRTA